MTTRVGGGPGDVVEEVLGAGEMVGADVEVAAEFGGGPGWDGARHGSRLDAAPRSKRITEYGVALQKVS